MKKLILVGILVLAMAAIGCGGEKEETAPPPEQASTPVDIFAIQTKWLTDFALGTELGADETVTSPKTTFASGETIHYSMRVADAPPASAAKVVWLGPNDAKLGEEMKGISSGQRTLSFQAPDTAAWAPGAYAAEIWVVDEKVNTQRFNLEAAAAPEPAPASKAKTKTKR
jgi:hypothetical protein